MSLMMQLEGCILWGDISGSGIIRRNYSICLEQWHVLSAYDHTYNIHMPWQRWINHKQNAICIYCVNIEFIMLSHCDGLVTCQVLLQPMYAVYSIQPWTWTNKANKKELFKPVLKLSISLLSLLSIQDPAWAGASVTRQHRTQSQISLGFELQLEQTC